MVLPFFRFDSGSDTAASPTWWPGSRDEAPAEDASLAEDHPDAALVRRVREGDTQAFARIFREYYRRLWALAYDLTGSGDLAEDAVQDVFATLWTRRAEWHVSYSIAEYLFGAVRNRTHKVRRHLAVVERTAAAVHEGDQIPALGTPPLRPDEVVEHADLRSYITTAVRAMPPGRRTALLLRWHDGLTYAEIAAVMGISAKAVSFQLSRAREELLALLKKKS